MAARVLPPNPTRPATKQTGEVNDDIRVWMQIVSDRQVIIGEGSPEGAIPAGKASLYMDESGGSGSILYIKKLDDIGGNKSEGWVLV